MWLKKYIGFRRWTPTCFFSAKVKGGGMGFCGFAQRAAEQKYRVQLSLGKSDPELLKRVLEVDARDKTRSLIKPSAPLSERKQRLHGAKRMGKYSAVRGLHLAHKGCLTGRFVTEIEFNLSTSVLHMALQVQSGALETEVWKAVVNRKGGLSICRTCGLAPPTLRHVLQVCKGGGAGKRRDRHNNMVRRIAKALREAGWFVEQEKVVGVEFGFNMRPDLIAVKGNVAAIIDPTIIGDLLSLDRVYRAKKIKYNKSLVRRSLSRINGFEKNLRKSVFDWKAKLGQPHSLALKVDKKRKMYERVMGTCHGILGSEVLLRFHPRKANKREPTKSIVLNRKSTKILWAKDPRGLVGQFLATGSYVPKAGGVEPSVRKWWEDLFAARLLRIIDLLYSLGQAGKG
ncbi:unnamed protein product [Lepeophtheirus salmonis]|uniref:(salmon louse) hypothetical protein n=1 Tax=Lepeophtheirus salmonis TaxID=72036 RepID=A0A817FES3_LEPSM|nr:unnamed protein product [Lepeophtheirus salmonis]